MGLLSNSVIVVALAIGINFLPHLFFGEVAVPPVTGSVEPGWEHVRDVYK